MCARCRRPRTVCYCAALPRLETRTRVVILQHPRERDMPIGTARMASLCLPGAELHVGVDWETHPALGRALIDPARPPILLYPGPGARDILREPPAGPVTLVVVDGTWSQARTVVRDNPVLRALPRYAFVTPEPSQYRIRKEPDAAFVSTIEALMHVLGALEGDAARFRALLEPLNAMVDAQLAYQHREGRNRWRKPRAGGPPPPRLPAELMERWDDLVCVVAEANAWPYSDGRGLPDELVHVVAERVATGERFDRVVAPAGELSPSTCFHVGLDEPTLRGGGALADVVAALAGPGGFVRDPDVLCAWGHYGLELLRDAGAAVRLSAAGRVLDMRAAAQRLENRKLGSLEAYAAGLAPGAAAGSGSGPGSGSGSGSGPGSGSGSGSGSGAAELGRGRRRLAMLARIARAWRELAQSHPRSS
jgi:DTW domain-containing protein YfiP